MLWGVKMLVHCTELHCGCWPRQPREGRLECPALSDLEFRVLSIKWGVSPRALPNCRSAAEEHSTQWMCPKQNQVILYFPFSTPKQWLRAHFFFFPTQKLPGDNAVTKLTSSKKTPKAKSCLLPLLNSKAPLKRKNKKGWGHAASDCNTRKSVIFRNRNRDHN